MQCPTRIAPMLARLALVGLACGLFAGCTESPFSRRTDVTSNQLLTTYYDGADTVWVGGILGTLLRRHGTDDWETVDLGVLDSVESIHGSTPGEVWVGTQHGNLFHVTASGVEHVDSPTSGDSIEAIWAFSSDDVFLVSLTSVYRGMPGAWTRGGVSVEMIYASSPDDIWLVEGLETALSHFDGTAWVDVETGLPHVPLWHDIWGAGDEFWLTGAELGEDADWVLHYDGSFHVERFDIVGDVRPTYGIGGASPTEIYRAGASGFVARFDGTSWQRIPGPAEDDLEDIVVTRDEVIAISQHGAIWTMPR